MNLKSKLVGVVAAGVLSLSIVSGAMAEDSRATFGENPDGTCSAAANASTVDFGDYTWVGDHYEAATQPVLNFEVNQSYGPHVGCDVQILASDLVNSDNTFTISKDNLQANNGVGDGVTASTYLGYNLTFVENGSGDYSYDLVINQLWNNHPDVPAPGTYTGTLTFTAVRTTP